MLTPHRLKMESGSVLPDSGANGDLSARDHIFKDYWYYIELKGTMKIAF